MVWRLVMRYLANNEQLIERLSQSNLMRRAAQMTVYFTLKWKDIGQSSLNSMLKSQLAKQLENNRHQSAIRMKSFSEKLSSELKLGLKNLQRDMKKKND